MEILIDQDIDQNLDQNLDRNHIRDGNIDQNLSNPRFHVSDPLKQNTKESTLKVILKQRKHLSVMAFEIKYWYVSSFSFVEVYEFDIEKKYNKSKWK